MCPFILASPYTPVPLPFLVQPSSLHLFPQGRRDIKAAEEEGERVNEQLVSVKSVGTGDQEGLVNK